MSLDNPDTIIRLKENALSGCSELKEVSFETGTGAFPAPPCLKPFSKDQL